MKRRSSTAAKTRHTKRVKRKSSDSRRDDARAPELLKAREQQLQHSSVQLSILIESIKDYAIYMLDEAGRIITWNSGAERLKGYSRDEIIGQNFSRFYTDSDRQSGLPTKVLRQAAADGKFEGEGWRIRKDGSKFWASVVINPIFADNGVLIGFAKVTRDVTDRHRAQELLEQKSKDLEIFSAKLQRERDNKLINVQVIVDAISHEIRQPLTYITAAGNAAQRFLKMIPPEAGRPRAALDGIVNAGHRIREIIDGFRALFAKDDQGREVVDLNEIIRDVLESLSSELTDHNVELRSELISQASHVHGNRGHLQEVISNLAVNAIEAMETVPNGSRVLHVRTELRNRNTVAVIVRDSGPGIEEDRLDGIFTAFVSTKPHGMGLGLPICRMIVEYHGGELTVSSTGKDGASFQFVLPIAPSNKDGAHAE